MERRCEPHPEAAAIRVRIPPSIRAIAEPHDDHDDDDYVVVVDDDDADADDHPHPYAQI